MRKAQHSQVSVTVSHFHQPEWKFNYLWLCLKPHKLSIANCGPVRFRAAIATGSPENCRGRFRCLAVVTETETIAPHCSGVFVSSSTSHSFANYGGRSCQTLGRGGGWWTFMPVDRWDWIIYGGSAGEWIPCLLWGVKKVSGKVCNEK